MKQQKLSNQVNWNTTKLGYALEPQYLFSNGCRCFLTYVCIHLDSFYKWGAYSKMLSSQIHILHTLIIQDCFFSDVTICLRNVIKLIFSDLTKELRNNKYWALSNIIIMKRFYIKYWINMKKLHISQLALFCLTCD